MSTILYSVDVQNDIRDRLLERLPYLSPANGGNVRIIQDTDLALNLEGQAPPAVLIEWGGDEERPPKLLGGIPRQEIEDLEDLFLIGRNFSASADAPPGEVGVQQMAVDVRRALRGYKLPTPKNSSGAAYVRLWPVRTARWGLLPECVIYRSQWRCEGIESSTD